MTKQAKTRLLRISAASNNEHVTRLKKAKAANARRLFPQEARVKSLD